MESNSRERPHPPAQPPTAATPKGGSPETPRYEVILGALRRILPRNSSGDAVYAWACYMRFHRRLPGRKGSGRFNDHLFRMKVDGTLFDPLRQFVTDKEYVKQYVAAVVGPQHTMETFQVLRTDEDVGRLELTRLVW